MPKKELINQNPEIELTEEELETVSGGIQQNSDGTYTFYDNDNFKDSEYKYVVHGDHINVDGNTTIPVTRSHLGSIHTNDYLAPQELNYTAKNLYDMWAFEQ